MPPLLVYSCEDAATITPLLGLFTPQRPPRTLAIDRHSDGSTLVERTEEHHGGLIVLVSPAFLTNPNCLYGLEHMIASQSSPLFLPVLTGEAQALHQQVYRTELLHHWQDRYLELRRDAANYTEAERLPFETYLTKIRSISTGLDALLSALQGHQPVPLEDEEQIKTRLTHMSVPTPQTAPTPAAPPQEPVTPEGILLAVREAKDTAAAVAKLREGLAHHPDSTELRYQLAFHLALDGQRDAAAESVADLLREYPQHHEALMLSGELHYDREEYEQARDDWETLTGLDPTYPLLHERLGLLLTDYFAGETEEALRHLRLAARRNAASSYALYRYAELLTRTRGKHKSAQKWLKKALKLDPELAPARYLLAVLLHRRGKLNKARAQFFRAVALQPAYDTAANRRAFAGAAAGPTDEKQTATLSALKQNIAELEELLRQRTLAAPAAPPRRFGDGRTALISGASSGIGRATAHRLAEAGFTVIALGRRKERLLTLQRELKKRYGTRVHPVVMDVRDREAVAELTEQLPNGLHDIDLLVNNAGKAKGFDPIYRGSIDHWEEMIDVNLKGLLYLTRAVTPRMVERGEGMVINVCSTAGKEVYPNGNVYCATKHAVDALTYAMRLDLVKHGIRVGQVCPAHVEETEFAVVRFDGDRERARIYDDFQPLRSRDVAEAIHFMVAQPRHVNVLDMVLQGTQQASSTVVDRSGRDKYAPEEE